MAKVDVIRAWKDEDYRLNLGAEERALVPENPAGIIDLSDSRLDMVAGGSTEHLLTIGCCSGLTTDPGFCSLQTCYSACVDPYHCTPYCAPV